MVDNVRLALWPSREESLIWSAKAGACRTGNLAWAPTFAGASRECPPCIVDVSLSGCRVVRELATITERRGLSCMVVSDNGTELTSDAVFA